MNYFYSLCEHQVGVENTNKGSAPPLVFGRKILNLAKERS
jgi:hypothetical protein